MRKINLIIALMLVMLPFVCLGNAPGNDGKRKKKEKTVRISADIYDSFTKGAIEAKITLMKADSTVVDTFRTEVSRMDSWFYFDVPRQPARYIIKAVAEGYEDKFVDYELKDIGKSEYKGIPQILMKRKARDIYKDVDLDEVVVRGTRIQVAYKGDTIVYDASAFNLPEGSMLDGLVRQLPGAELKENGDIYVHGEKIDYLTLNGKDFFKGENKIMLENLPYFTVKNLQVYHKSTKLSELLGEDAEQKDYVMDVVLKREYATGYLLNGETGAGTDNRWMGRMFGMLYGDHTKLTAFGNANNVNENREPGSNGDWKDIGQGKGLKTTKQVAVNLITEDKERKVKEELSTKLKWEDTENLTRSNSENYATGGSIFSGSNSSSRRKEFELSLKNTLQLSLKSFHLYQYATIDAGNSRSWSASQDSTYRDRLINSNTGMSRGKYNRVNANLHNIAIIPFKNSSYINLTLSGSYSSSTPGYNHSIRLTEYAMEGTSDLRNNYNDFSSRYYNYSASLEYTLKLGGNWRMSPRIGYSQNYNQNENSNYRLDWLGSMPPGGSGSGMPPMDYLPSTADSLQMALDAGNSYSYNTMHRETTGGLNITYSHKDIWFIINVPVRHASERMNYRRAALDTLAHRSYTTFSPFIALRNYKKDLRIQMNVYTSQAAFSTLMPYTSTTNPLNVTINNPALRATTTYKLEARKGFRNDSIGSKLYFSIEAELEDNAVGRRVTYNTVTGGYTSMSDNVDGNWNARLKFGYERPVDRKKRLRAIIDGHVGYTHSVDFDMAYDTDATALSKVNTLDTYLRLMLNYKYKKLSLGALAKVNARNSSGTAENFTNANTYDYKYGVSLQYTLPLINVTMGTNVDLLTRSGYQDAAMNRTDWMWNAQLSRSFLKGRITAKLQAFDILRQVSNIQHRINAQSRVETWTRCIPSYYMATLAFKLSKKPRK